MNILADDLRGPEIAALLQAHLSDMHRYSPPGSVHALDIAALRAPGISFWSAWEAGALLGCAALAERDAQHGEVKSMRTAAAHQRRGVARALLAHLIETARTRGYRRLSLETGSAAAFAPAHALYAAAGFVPCGPFADYREDPYSVFMTLELP